MSNFYSLALDGDDEEKKYYSILINKEFPEYEKFWDSFIVSLTRRPQSWDIKSTEELAAMGKTDNDVVIALLHRTLLEHLIRVYEIKQLPNPNINKDLLIEAIVRLVAGLDVADELLQRKDEANEYAPFIEEKGQLARKEWRKKNNNHSTKDLRKYRNAIIHGRARAFHPSSIGYPKIGKEEKYIDNRKVVHPDNANYPADLKDFTSMKEIIDDAWCRVLQYVREMWKLHLLT